MSQPIEVFIAERLAVLDAEEKAHREQIAKIIEERQALIKAGEAARSRGANQSQAKNGSRSPTDNIKPGTIMSEIVRILKKEEKGLIALDILAKINKFRDPPLLRTSLSPQLSRLKQSGYLELKGSHWKLSHYGKTQTGDDFGLT